MKRTSPFAAIAASLLFGSLSAAAADDTLCDDFPFDSALADQQRLLGDGAEAARFAELQPFTRELWAQDIVGERSFASALTAADVPATVVLELRRALAGTIDLDRELGASDRFYVRYCQPFTADGARIGVAQLVWAELRTKTKGTLALHHFRPRGGEDRLWFASGEAVGLAAIRLPLDIINISSGFGMRPDPLDKPGPAMGPLVDPAPVAAAPPPEPPPPPSRNRCRRRVGRASAGCPPSVAHGTCSTRAGLNSIALARSRRPRLPRRHPSRPRSSRLPHRRLCPSRNCSCMTASTSWR
jgi:hypothetical protein